MHVLTLDDFASAPIDSLKRVAGFLRIQTFPQMVLDRHWNWNRRSQGSRISNSKSTLTTLTNFFIPHNAHLASFLARHGQAHAVPAVRSWSHRSV